MTALFDPYRKNRYVIIVAYLLAIILVYAWLQPIAAQKNPARLVQTTIDGILVGGLYALTGLGIVVVTKASGVFNFAHGFMMVIGGLLFFSFFTVTEISVPAAFLISLAIAVLILTVSGEGRRRMTQRNLLIGGLAVVVLTALMTVGGLELKWLHAIVGAAAGSVLLGLIIERLAIRPLVGQPLFAMVLMTLAIAEILNGFIQLTWGPLDRALPIFQVFTDLGIPSPIRIDAKETMGGMIIVRTELAFAFIMALTAMGVFILFFRKTSIGLAMRAAAENQRLAQSVGLRVRTILAVVWGIAAVLAAIAGILQGGATSLTPAIALIALRAFPAVLLGGLESIEGVLIGGLVVGLVEKWADLLFPGTLSGTDLAPYVVLMIVLIIRPEGLFGEKRIERI